MSSSFSHIPKIAVAPMMDCTDRHYRYLARLLSPSVQLYTEMVTTAALIHGDPPRFLAHHPQEQPLVLQLGGSDPETFNRCIPLIHNQGFHAINLNIGCPSDRVQAGAFGACLMLKPQQVAECVRVLKMELDIPVTIKTRIGVDDSEDYAFLANFVETTAAVGCDTFIIHARKAWLKGLSPKENREIPPLNYAMVYHLKRDYPEFHIGINGGITTLAEVKMHLNYVDSVMIGRQAYHSPYFLAELEQAILQPNALLPSRETILKHFLGYVESQSTPRPYSILRHTLGLFGGLAGAREWRRFLTTTCTHSAYTPQEKISKVHDWLNNRTNLAY